jgi:CubicO group peptidase (beta-lactamase class C family)
MKNSKKIQSFLLISACLYGIITTTLYSKETQAKKVLDQNLVAIGEKYHVVGMTTLAVHNDKITYLGNIGLADIDRKISVTDSTYFRIASISKVFTGIAVMQLVEKRKLNLDEDIGTYLGYEVRNPHHPQNKITMRQLMTHTSSLTDNGLYDSLLVAARQDPPPSLSEILRPEGTFSHPATWQAYAPGDSFTYCNLGFAILATIVEKATGSPFYQYCKNNIFDPLGMKASFYIQDVPNVNNIAVLYRKEDSAWMPQTDNYRGQRPKPRNLVAYTPGTNAIIFSPQGGLRSTAKDLSTIMRVFINGGAVGKKRILKQSTVNEMLKIQWQGTGMEGYYKKKGLCIQITDDLIPGVALYGHGGDAYGLLSLMYFQPKKKYGMIFIMNGGDLTKTGLFEDVQASVAKELYQYIIRTK